MIKRLNLIAFFNALLFTMSVVITHLLKTELNWINHTLSQYALGEHGLIITVGFYCIGFTQVLLATSFMIFNQAAASRGALLLFAAGLGVFVVALFPTQPPSADMLTRLPHIAGASAHFLLFPLAVLALTPSLDAGRLKSFSFMVGYVTLIFFIVLLALFVMKPIIDTPFFGLFEKVNILIINIWLLVFSYDSNWYLSKE
ncbi:MAG: DUF998 domain-containing protein [Cycloclasticus sp.]